MTNKARSARQLANITDTILGQLELLPVAKRVDVLDEMVAATNDPELHAIYWEIAQLLAGC